MDIVVRSVDVGYGNTKYVTARAGVEIDCSHFLSVAALVPGGDGVELAGKRKTVRVRIGDVPLEVGPDVELATDRFTARPLHDNYSETAEYRALVSGALYFMKVPTIDLLVLGLPVALFQSKRKALAKAMTGTFNLGSKAKIVVRQVLVVAQPQGALNSYIAHQAANPSAIAKGRNLVIDVGARTFDWLVTNGLRVLPHMSHSVNRGTSDILRAVAQEISAEIGEEFRHLDALDRAFRQGGKITIYQKEHDLKRYGALVHHVASQAVGSLIGALDRSWDVENILLVGGGTPLFRPAIRAAFPRHQILEMSDPLYANVRGFQLLGEQYMRESAPAPAPKTPQLVRSSAGKGESGC